jgi:Uma2 family endonuclease
MKMAITERRMSLEEFLELPEEKPALELIDGVVKQKVAPDFLHGMLQGRTMEFINDFAESRGLAVASIEVRATLPGSSPVPDVSVYRWERAPLDERGNWGRFPRPNQPLPDIAIEIRSPDQTIREQVEKCRWFVAHGVPIALMLEPDSRTIWDCRPGREPRELRGRDEVDPTSVISGFTFAVDELFSRLRRNPDRSAPLQLASISRRS